MILNTQFQQQKNISQMLNFITNNCIDIHM